ncbi:hypothetical protein NKR19_g7573 [Coniochaeta hoffmannii]|uniref:Uncharacterized protein n=1 Tax=Coniochaeta hoffmannii TaxID=91930 RepID=A0AA38R8R8_9PEZI|nr:hypothetical protein NKR19_g7573 [Coniochaeta hoffmannii]
MSASGEDKKRETAIAITDDDDRPYVEPYVQKPAFKVGQRVYLLGRGPYLVAMVSNGRYVLSEENGDPVGNGAEFGPDQLQAV